MKIIGCAIWGAVAASVVWVLAVVFVGWSGLDQDFDFLKGTAFFNLLWLVAFAYNAGETYFSEEAVNDGHSA